MESLLGLECELTGMIFYSFRVGRCAVIWNVGSRVPGAHTPVDEGAPRAANAKCIVGRGSLCQALGFRTFFPILQTTSMRAKQRKMKLLSS